MNTTEELHERICHPTGRIASPTNPQLSTHYRLSRTHTLAAAVTAANIPDVTMLETVVDDIPPVRTLSGRRRTRPGKVDADNGYDSAGKRAWLRRRGITAGSPGVGSSRRLGLGGTGGRWSGCATRRHETGWRDQRAPPAACRSRPVKLGAA
jgi:hypothetical protein